MKKSLKITSFVFIGVLAAGIAACLSFGAKDAGSVKAEGTKTIYLDTIDFQWENDGAQFYVWHFNEGQEGEWSEQMSEVDGVEHLYKVDIPEAKEKVIFTRQNPNGAPPTWEGGTVWNQTPDLTLGSNNYCRLTDWNDGNLKTILLDVKDGCYILGSMNDWKADEAYKMEFNSDTNEYSLETSISKDCEFKIVSYSRFSPTWYGYDKLEEGTGSAKGTQIVAGTEDTTNMKAAVSGTFTPYFKTNTSTIWISEVKFIASFDLQGHGEAIEPQKDLNIGDKITAPEDPSEVGYVFGGWFKEAECSNAWNFDSDTISGDVTLYAKWEMEKIDSIKMASNPTKVQYNVGEELDLTGAKISVKTESGTEYEVDVTPEMVSGYDKTKQGKQTVTVTYGEKTTSFEVKVGNVPDPQPIPDPGNKGLGGGAIFGIILACIIGACLIAYFVMFAIWKKTGKSLSFLKGSFEWIDNKFSEKNKEENKEENPSSEPEEEAKEEAPEEDAKSEDKEEK